MDLSPILRRRPSRNKAALRKTVDQASRAVRLEKQKSGDITDFNRPRIALGLYDQKRLVLLRRKANRLGSLFRKRQIVPYRYPKSRQGLEICLRQSVWRSVCVPSFGLRTACGIAHGFTVVGCGQKPTSRAGLKREGSGISPARAQIDWL